MGGAVVLGSKERKGELIPCHISTHRHGHFFLSSIRVTLVVRTSHYSFSSKDSFDAPLRIRETYLSPQLRAAPASCFVLLSPGGGGDRRTRWGKREGAFFLLHHRRFYSSLFFFSGCILYITESWRKDDINDSWNPPKGGKDTQYDIGKRYNRLILSVMFG